jgi:hypothetical protein
MKAAGNESCPNSREGEMKAARKWRELENESS